MSSFVGGMIINIELCRTIEGAALYIQSYTAAPFHALQALPLLTCINRSTCFSLQNKLQEAVEAIDAEAVKASNVPALAILEWVSSAIAEAEDAAAEAAAAAAAAIAAEEQAAADAAAAAEAEEAAAEEGGGEDE